MAHRYFLVFKLAKEQKTPYIMLLGLRNRHFIIIDVLLFAYTSLALTSDDVFVLSLITICIIL